MIGENELLAAIDRLQADALRRWVALGWVTPVHHDGTTLIFEEVDVARIRLICDLIYDIEMDEESLPIILSLLDQLHGTRRLLKRLAGIVDTLPEELRRDIKAALDAPHDWPPDRG